ncbi:MAG: hypothetical protein HQL31_05560, partial [Planctomycetes bacterium]|nr:hypothetical protein [Planctomycetota bacterium]
MSSHTSPSPHWLILVYPNVSWEDSAYTHHLGSKVFPPDLFAAHLEAILKIGPLVSLAEGLERLNERRGGKRYFSLVFEGAFRGIGDHAHKILQERGLKAALALHPSVLLQGQLPWICKLSWLRSIDGMRFLRSAIRKRQPFPASTTMAEFLRHSLDEDFLRDLDEVYERFSRPIDRSDSHRLFMDPSGVSTLLEQGWELAALDYGGSEPPTRLLARLYESARDLSDALKAEVPYLTTPLGLTGPL